MLISWSAAMGQTVQQPVFQSFSTGTTVTVPDGGAALLGGISSARYGSTSRGTPLVGKLPGVGRLFNNQAIGGEFSSSQNYVRARIVDLHEMDQTVLNQARAGRVSRDTIAGGLPQGGNPAVVARQREARQLTQNMGRRPQTTRDPQRPVAEIPTQSDARRLLARGDQALAEGNPELATRYYRAAEQAAALSR